MTLATFSTSQEAQQAAALMDGYYFELGSHDAPQWVSLWLESYPPLWVRDAVIEALYQGRYKAFSVRQILELWKKRDKQIRHASHDFESTVCRQYGGVKLLPPIKAATAQPTTAREPAKLRASRRTHQSLSSISFNLSKTYQETPASESLPEPSSGFSAMPVGQSQAIRRLNGSMPGEKHHSFTPPSRQELIETAATLQAQHGLNGVHVSARAIQTFKPALPFSPEMLRLAKQRALATTR